MTSGTTGGRIASALTPHLYARFGRVRTNIGAGAFAVVLSLLLAAVYFGFKPVLTEPELVALELPVTKFTIQRSMLTVWSGENRYFARPRIWRRSISDDSLAKALKASSTITAWVYPGEHRIYGLSAAEIQIDKQAGIDEYMSDRFALLLLWVGFFFLGAATLGYGLFLKAREAQVQDAAQLQH